MHNIFKITSFSRNIENFCVLFPKNPFYSFGDTLIRQLDQRLSLGGDMTAGHQWMVKGKENRQRCLRVSGSQRPPPRSRRLGDTGMQAFEAGETESVNDGFFWST